MHSFVIILAILTIITAFTYKFYGISIIYPTLLIILTIICDVLSNVITDRKKQKNKKDDIENKKLN